MTIKIIKPTPIKSLDNFLTEYHFQKIPNKEFNIQTENRHPLRQHKKFTLYGCQSDSRLTGKNTTYFLKIQNHTYKSTLSPGSTKILFNELKNLLETNNNKTQKGGTT